MPVAGGVGPVGLVKLVEPLPSPCPCGGRRAHSGLGRLPRRVAARGLDNNVGELLGSGEPAQGVDGQLKLLGPGGRRLADLAGRHLQVLLTDGGDHVRDAQVEGRQFVRVEPGAQAVVALAQQRDGGDAGEAAQLVLDVDGRVVAEERAVVAVVGRDQVHDHQRARRHLLDVDALGLDQRRDDRQGQADAVLHQYLGHVGVKAQLEGDGQVVGAVVGALRGHVHHALDAADLFLDRRRHRVAHGQGVGPGVESRHLHRGRGDVGVLLHRQRTPGHDPRQDQDDRQDGGENRTVDEEMGDHGRLPPVDDKVTDKVTR